MSVSLSSQQNTSTKSVRGTLESGRNSPVDALSGPLPRLLLAAEHIESRRVLKSCVDAHAALAALRQTLQLVRGVEFIPGAVRSMEATAAIQLSGTPLSLADVLVASEQSRPVEVFRYFAAFEHARSRSDAGDSSTVLEMASGLAGKAAVIRRGKLGKKEQFGLGSGYRCPQGAENLQLHMHHWQAYLQGGATDSDPLVVVALAHCYLMLLRPLSTANIATAQLCSALLLIEEDMVPDTVLPLATFFSRNSHQYWRLLQSLALGEHPEEWVMFFLRAVTQTALDMVQRVTESGAILAQLESDVHRLLPAHANKQAVVQASRKITCSIRDLVDTGVVRRQTASQYLHTFVENGLMSQKRAGKEKMFINDALLGLYSQ